MFICSLQNSFIGTRIASGFAPPGFGQFTTKKYILFQIEDGIDINILALIPCIMLGLLGGLLGSLFVFLHLKLAKLRRKIQAAKENFLLREQTACARLLKFGSFQGQRYASYGRELDIMNRSC